MTDAYLRQRDGGELPRAAHGLLPRLRTLAAKECCDYLTGGGCLRRGRECLFRSDAPRRCTWFEEAVLPLDGQLQAEARAKLSVPGSSQELSRREKKALQAVCEAVDARLDRQRWVGVDDIASDTGLSRRGVHRVLPSAIAELGLRKHRRGRERWCLP